MGYQMGNGQWADTKALNLRDSAALSASANGAWTEVGDRGTLRLDLAVTAVTGTAPTLDVEIETASDSAGSDAVSLGSFTQKAAAGSQHLNFHGCDRFVRYRAVLGGSASPSVTFSLSGEAV